MDLCLRSGTRDQCSVRAYRLTGNLHLLDLLEGASKVFELETSEGGVRIPFGSCSLFMELPGGPAPGILDGFLTSLLGLYDFVCANRSAAVRERWSVVHQSAY